MERDKRSALILYPIAVCFFVLLSSGVAAAQDRGLGLGLIAGRPTGISGKYWVSRESAVDFAAAWEFGRRDSFQLHTDYLMHSFNMLRLETTTLPTYFGIGARLLFDEDDDTRFGLRVPFGLAYYLPRNPVEFFGELAPIVDLAPATKLDINAGVGVRFYFQ